MIARRKQPLSLHVPQHEREHAAQVFEQALAVALVQPDDDFAIAVRQKAMAVALRARGAARDSYRSRRCRPARSYSSALCSGWRPPARSMIDRRRWPSVACPS